jgi:AcrR family transcriptional regulator
MKHRTPEPKAPAARTAVRQGGRGGAARARGVPAAAREAAAGARQGGATASGSASASISASAHRDRGAATRPGARSAKAAARRGAILDAALEEFSARGFAAARLDDVARRAGIAKGTIYLYFADKEALFQELVRSQLTPFVGTLETAFAAEVPLRVIVDRVIELFVREIYGTSRKQVIRLIISEGPRFPALAEFYYREVLARVIGAVRALLRRAVERGELPNDAIVRFPQLLGAPAIFAIVWNGLFDRFEPLDVGAMMRTHFDLMFGAGRAP